MNIRKTLKEFWEFAMRGNVLDMAIDIIIAFLGKSSPRWSK
ncbi:MAG: MscL family protein [Candidatus Omnitrophota bacterium]